MGLSIKKVTPQPPPPHLGCDAHVCRQTSVVLGPDGAVAGPGLVDTTNLKEVTGGSYKGRGGGAVAGPDGQVNTANLEEGTW